MQTDRANVGPSKADGETSFADHRDLLFDRGSLQADRGPGDLMGMLAKTTECLLKPTK